MHECEPEHTEHSRHSERRHLVLVAVAGGLLAIGYLIGHLVQMPQAEIAVFLVAMLIAGAPIAVEGFKAVFSLQLDMNTLMTVAAIGAVAIGAWDEAATVIWLFALAELLEDYSADRARKAIGKLMELAPNEATVKRDGQEIRVPVEQVSIGEVIVIKPGEKIPLDGKVVKGSSSVNQAPITGESLPVEKREGDLVFAGSINSQGAMEVQVTHLAKDTTIARIIRMVEEAEAQRAPSQRFVDRFARYYTPTVIAGALLVMSLPPLLFGQPFGVWFYRALVLLVIACPCALVISTPVAIVSGLASAARNGVLIKGGIYLEQVGTLKAIAFDKTGTLTKGTPEITDVIPLNNHANDEVLKIAAALESRSEHPLAQAVLRKAAEQTDRLLYANDFQALPGLGAMGIVDGKRYFIGKERLFEEQGIPLRQAVDVVEQLQSEGKTVMLLGEDNHICGVIAVADQIRDAAPSVIAHLHPHCVEHMVMLTGDNKGTAQAIAKQLGINDVRAELLPQDKVRVVQELLRRYGPVAMVGDGVNDAPALAAATIGIAMGTAGSDTALETADIALMGDDLTKLSFAIHLSRRTLRIVKFNIAFSISIKALFLLLALVGKATLWMAVAADMGASLLVVANSLRLLTVREVRSLPTRCPEQRNTVCNV